jgi:hypothetical protein
MILNEKLRALGCFTDLDQYIKQIDTDQIERFVKAKVNYLFTVRRTEQIQQCVIDDSFPDILTFLTHVVEIGSVKSIGLNNLNQKSRDELDEIAYILSWAYNFCLANELKKHGMSEIPSMQNGRLDIYFSDDALLRIADGIVHHVNMARSYGTNVVHAYANELIVGQLILS